MATTSKTVTLEWMTEYHKKLLNHLDANYYTQDQIDELLAGLETGGISDWVSGFNYKKGNIVIFDNKLFKAIVDNSSDSFNPEQWQSLSSDVEIEDEDIDFSKWLS